MCIVQCCELQDSEIIEKERVNREQQENKHEKIKELQNVIANYQESHIILEEELKKKEEEQVRIQELEEKLIECNDKVKHLENQAKKEEV